MEVLICRTSSFCTPACFHSQGCKSLRASTPSALSRFQVRKPLKIARTNIKTRAEAQNDSSEKNSGLVETTTSPAAETPKETASVTGKPKSDEGAQTTAIITGAVSIICGVLYFMLVRFMDSRGAELLPPPPEAFGL